MDYTFPETEMSAIGGWCLSEDQCWAALARRNVPVDFKRTVPEDALLSAYQCIVGKPCFVRHCFTAPIPMGPERCKVHYVFIVTARYIETSRVRYTAEGLEIDGVVEPDADALAKLRTLLRVGPADDISEFARRFAALPLTEWADENDCETILGNLSLDLGVARKDVVFRLFQEPGELAGWVTCIREIEVSDSIMREYVCAEDAHEAGHRTEA